MTEAQRVLEELRDYWPVTLRQIYYRLVAGQILANHDSQYKRLSRLLKDARLEGLVPWEAMEDRSRDRLDSDGWSDASAFVEREHAGFLTGYRRDLLYGQRHALEIWIEKDALSVLCHDVAFPYCVPVIVARGYSSVSFVNDCRNRTLRARRYGKEGLWILYFGDLDPSGWDMLPAMLRTLKEKMGLGDDVIGGVHYALTPEQVAEFSLPYSYEALKPKDPRTPAYRKWLRAQGLRDDMAVELDALLPTTLQGLVEEAIRSHIDLDLFAQERDTQELEAQSLDRVRLAVEEAIELAAEEEGL